MSEFKIKCPTCGKILRLLDAPNINTAAFTCPVCNEKHIVGKCQRYVERPMSKVPSDDETRYCTEMTKQDGGDETQICSASQPAVGMLVDAAGRIYPLRLGLNTIGRKAISSSATLQIDTDDRTMSRNHAVIEVRHTGAQTIHILRNGANKNPSYLNCSLIEQKDQLILNNGDRIKMGNTELTFNNTPLSFTQR